MKIKKGDKVVIISGKDRGKTGGVEKSLPKESKVVVSGLNIAKKMVKPSKKNPGGGIIEFNVPVSVSDVAIICSHCGKKTRVGYVIKDKTKIRICKRCKETL